MLITAQIAVVPDVANFIDDVEFNGCPYDTNGTIPGLLFVCVVVLHMLECSKILIVKFFSGVSISIPML